MRNNQIIMEKSDFMALAAKKWEEIKAQKGDSATFYDYEKAVDELWAEVGRQAFEGSLGKVPSDRPQKNKN